MANLPPTPAPSTDIAGKATVPSTQLDTISLPPAALRNGRASVSSSGTTDAASDSSYRPLSPASPAACTQRSVADKPHGASSPSRKRSSDKADMGAAGEDSYALPPPPTRSRKIIQMKPKASREKSQEGAPVAAQSGSKALTAAASTWGTSAGGGSALPASGRKRPTSTSTAVGRKIARKTAHSLIERRRRSKMNEEFGVLKDMIPACSGQDMHKLAILQASIEYMRYLESCVAELKAAHKNCKPLPDRREANTPNATAYTASTTDTTPAREVDYEDGEASDEEMTDHDEAGEASLERQYTRSTAHSRPSASPAILPSATTSPLFNLPSISRNQSLSNFSSPVSYAQQAQHSQRLPSLTLTSPLLQARQHSGSLPPPNALPPINHLPPAASLAAAHGSGNKIAEHDEATASALLMLNTDRRSWTGRGMSVKDLLSSQ